MLVLAMTWNGQQRKEEATVLLKQAEELARKCLEPNDPLRQDCLGALLALGESPMID